MITILPRRLVPIVPVAILLALVGVGIATTLGASAEDRGPTADDYLDADGNPDLVGYLVADGQYETAPAVPADEPIEFSVTGCVEGEPLAIAAIPRVLVGDAAAANDALADDDPEKLTQEPVPLVEEEAALADGSAYELTIPRSVPLGFSRLRVTCGDLEWDTIIDLVDREEFEAAQEELGDDEEPEELVTALDSAPVPEES